MARNKSQRRSTEFQWYFRCGSQFRCEPALECGVDQWLKFGVTVAQRNRSPYLTIHKIVPYSVVSTRLISHDFGCSHNHWLLNMAWCQSCRNILGKISLNWDEDTDGVLQMHFDGIPFDLTIKALNSVRRKNDTVMTHNLVNLNIRHKLDGDCILQTILIL